MKKLSLSIALISLAGLAMAEPVPPPNGVQDRRSDAVALTGATIQIDPDGRLPSATLLVRRGRVVAVREGRVVPAGYVEHDLGGRFVYPGLIDLDSGYGLPAPGAKAPPGSTSAEVLESPTDGAFGVNQAIRSEFAAARHFTADPETAQKYRELGFGAVLSYRADGIARGTGALVTLGQGRDNELFVLPEASAHFSFDKGSSEQSYPSSMMGAVALLRQSWLDAEWFARQTPRPSTDLSLEAWQMQRSLPKVLEVEDWKALLRAAAVGDELGVDFVVRGSGDEYRRAYAVADAGVRLILPVRFPEPPSVSDPFDSRAVSLEEMKHWELAPSNPAILDEAGVSFAITSGGQDDFWKQLRRALERGLSERTALAALTTVPAAMLGVEDRLGSIREGSIANFLVTSGELFEEETILGENWIQGHRFVLTEHAADRRGPYRLEVDELGVFEIELGGEPGRPEAKLLEPPSDEGSESSSSESDFEVSFSGELVNLTFQPEPEQGRVRLSGWMHDTGWQGRAQLPDGRWVDWNAQRKAAGEQDESEKSQPEASPAEDVGPIIYPFTAYGWTQPPAPEPLLIRNATVWTNEEEGVLEGSDVLVRKGKIAALGPGLVAPDAREIDATGLHLTPGIIDEHSHIALSGVNDVAANSGMVRMLDVLDSEDIDIYRNLAGGVTAAQLLHGSANPIGGQSALIKMRWGAPPEELLIEGADGFIKFALGENVKRSRNRSSIRYPQTRMGVEQVYRDAFTAARDYRSRWQAYRTLSSRERATASAPRRDLALETMVEILEEKRFISCHSYVQSEMAMLMAVAEDFGFRVNTFTHVLEGYKVADRLAEHGAGGSTFADWWAYKWEVRYAIPYNPVLMHEAGVTVAVNSDSAEMSRRLNQEAAKAVKYGGMPEEDALKLVTLNPAKLLHLDDRMGSIQVGKDADLVLWSDHPLSIYAVARTTLVDGIVFYDLDRDLEARGWIQEERARLVEKIGREKPRGGAGGSGSRPPKRWRCDSRHGYEYLLEGGAG